MAAGPCLADSSFYRESLDGSTALMAAGLTGYDDEIHLSLPHGSTVGQMAGARRHEIRRWAEGDTIVRGGLRTTQTALAAIHAAIWARTRRQAALILVMAVQQRVTAGPALLAGIAGFERLRWRSLITGVVLDVCDGVQSLGELDVARECRRRGLPEPDRQVVRRGRRGRVYLDAHFQAFGLVLEIECPHHDGIANAIDDSLRQNELSIANSAVLRIPLVGWRIDPEPFLDQLERALQARGGPARDTTAAPS